MRDVLNRCEPCRWTGKLCDGTCGAPRPKGLSDAQYIAALEYEVRRMGLLLAEAEKSAAGVGVVHRPLGCALAMRVMQSDLYKQLDEAERADCDELVQRNLEWFKRDSATGVTAVHAPAPPNDKITIRYERPGRCFWHIGCKAQRHAPPMAIGEDDAEKRRTVIRCTACDQAGYYPHGCVGDVCCERVPAGVLGTFNDQGEKP